MEQALDHEWLAGPLSQTSESQRQKLGGDSMWSIESFDDDFPPEDGEDADRRWTRPGTVSGTNLESGVGGDSVESFSQPMGNLRIHTAGDRGATGIAAKSVFPVDEPQSYNCGGVGSLSDDKLPPSAPIVGPLSNASPPSPPLTDDQQEQEKLYARLDAEPTPLRTNGASVIGPRPLNRKPGSPTPAAKSVDGMFSSSSLSPPPGSEERAGTPGPSVFRPASSTAKRPIVSTNAKRKTRDDTANTESIAVVGHDGGSARQSPRRSARPRKSIRLS